MVAGPTSAINVIFFVASLCIRPSVAQGFLRNSEESEFPFELYGSDVVVVNRTDVEFLASDELGGRNDGTTGSLLAQEFLIDKLQAMGAVGLVSSKSGRDAFRQDVYSRGTNILGILPGSDLSNEHIFLSAHYDHISFCEIKANADSNICNGATDNAAGVAVVLGIGSRIAELSERPRRSIVFGFWDREEDGLIGSQYFIEEDPLIPLSQITTLLNFDIMGSNLLPSLRKVSFAIGAESGGSQLEYLVEQAVISDVSGDLNTVTISAILGSQRSDYFNFYEMDVPIVFFSDSTGPCYHTNGDEIKNVDFDKLEKQARVALKLTYNLATTNRKIKFTEPCINPTNELSGIDLLLFPAEFSDLRVLNNLVNQAYEDIDLFPEAAKPEFEFIKSELNCLTRWGPIAFPFILALDTERLFILLPLIDIFTTPECAGFQADSS
ncbi:Peptidase family M28 [Seminavis robusta]|uniref:Peptidase family M28 n=1 Tax=Seminavis robusta TaxID=568900 RepID=A0A9N8DHK4_9STRA|nr:Peptidase family M28 [Seminavis robusta]|eukprot:Sro147_g067780.1 Peptidase family M28 (438) ;mRNA; f:38903-40216